MSSDRLIIPEAAGRLTDEGIELKSQVWVLHAGSSSGCFPVNESGSRNFISYRSIVWCAPVEGSGDLVELDFIDESSQKGVVLKLAIEIDSYGSSEDASLSTRILKLAYGQSQQQPSILVIVNNHGGKGKAGDIYKWKILPVLTASRSKITYMETKHPKHAVHIGQTIDVNEIDIVACCSGDGIPHEIINGMFLRRDKQAAFEKLALTQLPCGSGNAFSLSSHGTSNATLATLSMLKLKRSKMDLMAVSQKEDVKLSFLSQAYGAIADSDIGTEHMRWMGAVRFEVGLAQKIFIKAIYPCDLYVKYAISDKSEIQSHYSRQKSSQSQLMMSESSDKDIKLDPSVLPTESSPKLLSLRDPVPSDWVKVDSSISENISVFYVGKMPYVLADAQFFPAALHDDGYMDMVICDGRNLIFQMIKLLLSVDKGHHIHCSGVQHSKILGYRLVPKMNPKNHYISVDGESFPFEPMQVEVIRGLLTILLPNGTFVDTRFGR